MNATLTFDSDEARHASLAAALGAVYRDIKNDIGDEDVARLRRLDRLSRRAEVLGRVLLHFSFEPIGWTSPASSPLWVHKQIQATEIGHPALHGCYDNLLEGAGAVPQQELHAGRCRSTRRPGTCGHNLRHHPYTNVTGKRRRTSTSARSD